MTPDTEQARAGYRRPPSERRDASSTDRSGALEEQAARAGHWGAVARSAHAATRSSADAERTREDASIVGVVPLLAVLVVTIAGVYLARSTGSVGGGEGGVVAGSALLVAAAARLLLPSGLVGLLATRKRATDVVALTIFGVGLLVLGLVLPR